MNNKYTRTNWKTENNGQKTRKQNKVEAPWLQNILKKFVVYTIKLSGVQFGL